MEKWIAGSKQKEVVDEEEKENERSGPVKVIFDTDIGTDGDAPFFNANLPSCILISIPLTK